MRRVVLITGASRGIGRAIALQFALEGAHLVIGGQGMEGAQQTATLVRQAGGEATVLPLNVACEEQVSDFVAQALNVNGNVDVLINNAGIAGPVKMTHDVTLDEWMNTVSVNLTGAFLCCKYVLPFMMQQGSGAVVNVSSVLAKRPAPLRSVYAASKMGMIGFTRAVATDYGPYGIRVNCVCPGAIEGTRQDEALANAAVATGRSVQELADEKLRDTPLRTFIKPESVAQVVAFLCSDEARGMTGQDINVSGGRVMC